MTQLSVTATIGVCVGEPLTYNQAGFAALTYTDIGEVVTIGEFGGQAQHALHMPLATGIVQKHKGSVDYGSLALELARIQDSGQDMLRDAFDGAESGNVHSFHITSINGEHVYFTAVVGSFVTVHGQAITVTGINSNIELDNEVVLVMADGTEYLLAWGAWRFEDGVVELV